MGCIAHLWFLRHAIAASHGLEWRIQVSGAPQAANLSSMGSSSHSPTSCGEVLPEVPVSCSSHVGHGSQDTACNSYLFNVPQSLLILFLPTLECSNSVISFKDLTFAMDAASITFLLSQVCNARHTQPIEPVIFLLTLITKLASRTPGS